MKAGVDLLISAAGEGDRICIYGDYDADGVTASTVMACGVSRLTDNWFFYIPSRFEEGYGLNVNAIDKIIERGADLVITVDCGCVSVNEEHGVIGGLGDAVAQVVVKNHPCRMAMIGQQDTYGESGKPDQLLAKYHMTAEDIAEAVRKIL